MSRYTRNNSTIAQNVNAVAAGDNRKNAEIIHPNPAQEQEPTLKDIYKLIAKVDSTVSNLSTKFDNLDIRTSKLEKENVELKEDIVILQSRLCDTENYIQHIQQKQFENYITILNLPVSQNENLPELVISAVALLQIEISKENIRVCKRIGGYGGNYTPLTLVEFDTNNLKETILEIAKKSGPILPEQLGFAGTTSTGNQKVLFGQYITKYTQQLLRETKKLRTKHQIEYIWQNYGTVLIKLSQNSKTIFKIKTFEDLNKFINSQLSN